MEFVESWEVGHRAEAQPSCSSQHGNVFDVGKYCYVVSARWRARPLGAHGGGEGREHIVSPRAQLVFITILWPAVFARTILCDSVEHALSYAMCADITTF